MKQKSNQRMARILAGLALAGSTSLCLAQSPITQNFNSGASSITDFGIDWAGAIAWDGTAGVDGSGCLKVTLSGSDATPKWTITGGPIRTADYLQVDYDLRFDVNSGADTNGAFGNYQEVFRDAGSSWESHWVGAIYPGTYVDWTHMSFSVPNNGKQYPTLDWVLQGGAPYTSNVVFYIDNIVISPVPNPYIWDAFTNDISGWSQENWTGVPGSAAWNTTQDAGGGFTPLGSLQLSNAFTTGWQQSWHQHSVSFAPSRYNFFEFDVKVDTANSVVNTDGSYGQMQVSIRNPSWSDNVLPPGAFTLSSNYTSWQHVKLSLGNHSTNDSSPALDLEFIGNHAGPVQVFVDNIKLTRAVAAPKIYALLPGTPGGTKIFVDGNGTDNQWDEEGISVPAADCATMNFFPMNQTPASYSFTLSQFPSPASAPGFQAHMYIVNGDSFTANGGDFNWNQTYSGVPWNAYDYMGLRIENAAGGGVNAIFEWKTNAPSSNATNRQVFAAPQYTTANGTWTVNFSDNTHGTILGPDGASVGAITLPDFQADPQYSLNFTPVTSCLQFGVNKNDANNTGVNNDKSAYLTRVVVTNWLGVIYNDSFPGPGLTASYLWRVAKYWKYPANRVLWEPYGTAFWLKYGDPAAGYSVQSVGSFPGTWADAGATWTYTDDTGTNHFYAIPTNGVPAGNSAYFRLYKP